MSSAAGVVGNPRDALAVKNYKYVKESVEIFLADRGITELRGFEPFVNIEVLWLQGNRLVTLGDTLAQNSRLKEVYLANNRLKSLGAGLNAKFLEVLDLSSNSLSNLSGLLKLLERNQYLISLDLSGNPVAEEDQYRLRVLSVLPTLKVFDRRAVRPDEREAARLHREREVADAKLAASPTRATAARRTATSTSKSSAAASALAPEVSACVQLLERELRRTMLAQSSRDRLKKAETHTLRLDRHAKRANAEAPLAAAINFLDRETTAPRHVLLRWDRRRLLNAFSAQAAKDAAALPAAAAAESSSSSSSGGGGPLVRFTSLPSVLRAMEDEGLACRAASAGEAEATLAHLQRYDRRTVRQLFTASAVQESKGQRALLAALLHPTVDAAMRALCLPSKKRHAAELAAAAAGSEHGGVRRAVELNGEWWVPLDRFELALTSPSVGWDLVTAHHAQRRSKALFASAAKLDRRNGALNQPGLSAAEAGEAAALSSVAEYLALSQRLAKEGRIVAARQALAFAARDGVEEVDEAVLTADAKLREMSGSVAVAAATRMACLHSELATRDSQQRKSASGQAEALIDRSGPATQRFGKDMYKYRSWGAPAAAIEEGGGADAGAPERTPDDLALCRKFGLTGRALEQFERLRKERASRKLMSQRTAMSALVM